MSYPDSEIEKSRGLCPLRKQTLQPPCQAIIVCNQKDSPYKVKVVSSFQHQFDRVPLSSRIGPRLEYRKIEVRVALGAIFRNQALVVLARSAHVLRVEFVRT